MSTEETQANPSATDIEVLPCYVFGCIDVSHRYVRGEQDEICCSITVNDGDPGEGFYIAGYRDSVTGIWSAWSDQPELGDLDGSAGLVTLERFLTAFRAVHEHCEALNKITAKQLVERAQNDNAVERLIGVFK